VYNFQHAGAEGEAYLWYDQPTYDPFWKACVERDVPLYINPSAPVGHKDYAFKQIFQGRKHLVGPPHSFSMAVSTHLLGLVVNGVFDRFAKLKISVSHLGERIPFEFWCFHHWIQDVERPRAQQKGDVMCERDDISHCFKINVWFTTSGHFHAPTLKYVCDYIGADRVLFSVDYPYESVADGCGWWDGDAEVIQKALGGREAYHAVGRQNAKKLFKLGSTTNATIEFHHAVVVKHLRKKDSTTPRMSYHAQKTHDSPTGRNV
jgi:2,3-dihydroxybenzoate decarboxylase